MNVFVRKIMLRLITKVDKKDFRFRRKFISKEYGVIIGKYTYGYNPNDISSGTKIGAFCSFASGVKIGQMNHPTNFVSSHPFLYYINRGFINENYDIRHKKDVIIEDDVWVGNNVMILPGVKISKGAVIGAGAVITNDVPPYAIVGGVPARLLKWRFNEVIRRKLVEIDWASWDDDRIKKAIPYFYDVNEFINKFEKGEL